MLGDEPGEQKRAIDALTALAASGLGDGVRGLAAELRDRAPAHTTRGQLQYHLFALIFAGQLTTDAALGSLIARALTDGPRTAPPDEGEGTNWSTRRCGSTRSAPFTLWRFTTTELVLAGTRLPARAPVLVDILGINTDPARSPGPDLTFGSQARTSASAPNSPGSNCAPWSRCCGPTSPRPASPSPSASSGKPPSVGCKEAG